MKKLLTKIRTRIKQFFTWFRREVLVQEMLTWLIVSELLFWSPAVICIVLGAIVDTWYFTGCGAYMAFWATSLVPAILLQLGLAFSLKKLADFIKRKKRGKSKKN